eukprot:gene9122-1211_t
MRRTHSSFDINTYIIEFNSVFYFKEIGEHFFEFLQTEYNPEPFLCVTAIDELNELTQDKDIITKCNEIVKKFINPDAEHEVNISETTKRNLLNSLKEQLTEDEWILEETAYEIFFPLKRILCSELNADNFPRFVRTKKFIDMVGKYSDDPRVMKVITALKYPFTDEYYEKPFITKSEISFLNELTQDSFAWEPIYTKNRFNVYVSRLNFLPESKYFSQANTYKIHATLPYSFEKVATFFLSLEHLKKADSRITDISVRETYSVKKLSNQFPDDNIANQINSIIGETCVQPPFPISTPRKSIDAYCIDFDNESQTLTFIRRPYLGDFKGNHVDWSKKMKFDFTDKKKEKKTCDGYMAAIMTFIKIEIIDSCTTRLTLLSMVDPKGYMQNSFIMDNSVKMMGSNMENTFSKALKNMPKDISLESFKSSNSEPFMNLAYKVLKKKETFSEINFFAHPFTDEDLKNPFIHQFEFDYFSELSTDVHWDLIYSGLKSKVYFSKSNFIPNSKVFGKAIHLMIERSLDISFDKLVYCYFLQKKREITEPHSTKIKLLKEIHPKDLINEEEKLKLTENTNSSFLFNHNKYATFPVKTARKMDYTESIRMSSYGNIVTALERTFISDLETAENFDKKIKFSVFDKKQQKEIDVEGYNTPTLRFSKIEKINEKQTKISVLMIVDPKFYVNPGKMGVKMVVTLFGKTLFKQIDSILSDVPDNFSFENLQVDENEEPLVALLKNLFQNLYK